MGTSISSTIGLELPARWNLYWHHAIGGDAKRYGFIAARLSAGDLAIRTALRQPWAVALTHDIYGHTRHNPGSMVSTNRPIDAVDGHGDKLRHPKPP